MFINRRAFEKLGDKAIKNYPEGGKNFQVLIKNTLRSLHGSISDDKLEKLFSLPSAKLREFTIAVEVCKRILPLRKIVGFQPIEGPVGLIKSMTYTQSNAEDPSFQILLKTATAKTRKLGVQLSDETMYNLSSHDDEDSELLQLVSDAIVKDITGGIIHSISTLATEYQSRLQDLQYTVLQVASILGSKNKRGGGNFIVVSSRTWCAIGKYFSPQLLTTIELKDELLPLVGKIGKRLNVYLCDSVEYNTILVGYLGNTMDAGLIFCPYIPFVSMEKKMNETTYMTSEVFATRYFMYEKEKEAAFGGSAADYYSKIVIGEIE